MKGTFFSTDFVKDNEGNLKFLEMNTDTSVSQDFLDNYFDWSDFINILKTNQINKLEIVYKPTIQVHIVEHLEEKLQKEYPTIQINHHHEKRESIFPLLPEDDHETFVLRMSYDESAVLDSQYTKSSLNPLVLFHDNGHFDKCVPFYFDDGDKKYNTITDNVNNLNIPDLVVKSVIHDGSDVQFWKLGDSNAPENRVANFIENTFKNSYANDGYYVTNYLSSRDDIALSVRHYGIVYGENMEILTCANEYVTAHFTYPYLDFEYPTNDLPFLQFHKYEFSTGIQRDTFGDKHGLFETENILLEDGTSKSVTEIDEGDVVSSLYIEGLPDSDIPSEYMVWKHSGDSLPSGSKLTSSTITQKPMVVGGVFSVIEIQIENEEPKYFSDSSALLVYDIEKNEIRFKNINKVTKDNHKIVGKDGTLKEVMSIKHQIYSEPVGHFYVIDADPVDTLISDGYLGLTLHNAFCFVGDTSVRMADGTEKKIQDIKVGDEVLSLNEKSNIVESNKVLKTKQSKQENIIKITLDDNTTIKSTSDHPYYTDGMNIGSFDPKTTEEKYNFNRKILQLEVGSVLYNGGLAPLKIVKIEQLKDGEVNTYIMEVDNNHNFFANDILVHNKKCFMPGAKILMNDYSETEIENIQVGDKVLNMHGETEVVEDVFVYNVQGNLEMYTNGDIIVTDTHPMYLNKKWQTADEASWDKMTIFVDKLYNLKTKSNFIVSGIPADGTTHDELNILKDLNGFSQIQKTKEKTSQHLI